MFDSLFGLQTKYPKILFNYLVHSREIDINRCFEPLIAFLPKFIKDNFIIYHHLKWSNSFTIHMVVKLKTHGALEDQFRTVQARLISDPSRTWCLYVHVVTYKQAKKGEISVNSKKWWKELIITSHIWLACLPFLQVVVSECFSNLRKLCKRQSPPFVKFFLQFLVTPLIFALFRS